MAALRTTFWERLASDDDALLERATVAIFEASGLALLGTGTLVTAYGAVLTAHHVVSRDAQVLLRKKGGEELRVDVADGISVPENDLAVLPTNFGGRDALPITMTDATLLPDARISVEDERLS